MASGTVIAQYQDEARGKPLRKQTQHYRGLAGSGPAVTGHGKSEPAVISYTEWVRCYHIAGQFIVLSVERCHRNPGIDTAPSVTGHSVSHDFVCYT